MFLIFCFNADLQNGQQFPSNVHKESSSATATTFGVLRVVFPFLWGCVESTDWRKEACVENSI